MDEPPKKRRSSWQLLVPVAEHGEVIRILWCSRPNVVYTDDVVEDNPNWVGSRVPDLMI
ncbi:MAG: hypothetical protein U0521_26690 [Anaerolineae bacterium]